jgi:hypothetical protein
MAMVVVVMMVVMVVRMAGISVWSVVLLEQRERKKRGLEGGGSYV